MFYLKYRPHTIDELDNSQIRTRITNVLKSKQIPHAMLFLGPKGMGKTSTARIVAKAINCLNNSFAKIGNSIEPCNSCANCAAIETGSSPDVVEQDAASNRGIEEVRRLIKESAFAPMSGRYRVYIIDEAHMITNDAFNALLKTLEEPPETVVFILATTNEEKLPSTIVSRCLRVPFGHAPKSDIIHMLDRIAKHEKIKLSDDIKELIANYSENSFRDAAKLLEELVTQDKLTINEAQKYLGVHAKQNLLDVLQSDDKAAAIQWIQDFVQDGGNVRLLIENLLHKLHTQILVKNKLSEEHDTGISEKELILLMKKLLEARELMKESPIESLPLEIAVIEFYNQKS